SSELTALQRQSGDQRDDQCPTCSHTWPLVALPPDGADAVLPPLAEGWLYSPGRGNVKQILLRRQDDGMTRPRGRRGSPVAVQLGETVAVIGRIAKAHLGDSRPLDEETDVMLVGHADAAMHLNRFIGNQHEGI